MHYRGFVREGIVLYKLIGPRRQTTAPSWCAWIVPSIVFWTAISCTSRRCGRKAWQRWIGSTATQSWWWWSWRHACRYSHRAVGCNRRARLHTTRRYDRWRRASHYRGTTHRIHGHAIMRRSLVAVNFFGRQVFRQGGRVSRKGLGPEPFMFKGFCCRQSFGWIQYK